MTNGRRGLAERTFCAASTAETGQGHRKYAFLGSKQRESLIYGHAISMGVRTYSPYTGRFLQTDPVLGGSANTYDYANQDPINQYDLDGRCAQCAAAASARRTRGRDLSHGQRAGTAS